jgi:hypothetical protein
MKKSFILAPDDLSVGRYFAVVGCKDCDTPVNIAGQAFNVLAINLPFVVGKLVCAPDLPSMTFDVRHLNFMRVDKKYIQAQRPKKPS